MAIANVPEKKQSWIARLAEKVGYEKKNEHKQFFDTTNLAEAAVQIMQDRKLSERLDAMDILNFAMIKEIPSSWSPKEQMEALRERAETFNQMIQMIAAPYARSGNYPSYSRLMHGWNKMYGIALSWITMTEMYFTDNDSNNDSTRKTLSDNTIIVNSLRLALTHHIFPDAYDVIAYCYKDEDVRPKAVTVIQSTMPPNFMNKQIDMTGDADW
jgi:hypothetical protein